MARCKHFIPVEPGSKETCDNCQRWKGERCRDEQMLREQYEDSKEFKLLNHMMRKNKGVVLP